MSVLDGTKRVIVIPGLKKAAFIVGGDYGRGIMTCLDRRRFQRAVERADHDGFGRDIGLQLGVEGH